MVLTVLLLMAMWLIVMREPNTPMAKVVWRVTVVGPGDWASRIQRGHLLLVLIFTVALLVVVHWIGREGVQLIAMSAPEIGTWLGTFEVATYLDAIVAVGFAASTINRRDRWFKAKAWLLNARPVIGRRPSRTHRCPVKRPKPSNDDDGRHAWAA